MNINDLTSTKQFFLLAGPCVIEGEEMALRIAERVAEITARLGIPYVFKGSSRKANRSRIDSFTSIGGKVRERLGIPTVTDIHETHEAALAAEFVDVLQIPAFLCRQTDLLIAAAHTGRIVNIKKGQFLAPDAMRFAAQKVVDAGNPNVMLTERGTTFGYTDLVVDFRGIPRMQAFGHPVVTDITHSLQQPNLASGVAGGMPELLGSIRGAAVAGWGRMGSSLRRTRTRPRRCRTRRTCCRSTGWRDCSRGWCAFARRSLRSERCLILPDCCLNIYRAPIYGKSASNRLAWLRFTVNQLQAGLHGSDLP